MGMNKTNGNMYPWVSHTWNPLAGKCQHKCQYCYMKEGFLGKLDKYEGEVEVAEKELNTNLGSENIIFVGSATDLFGEWVPDYAIEEILDYCRKFSNKYLFQSKNPSRIEEFLERLPEKSIIGTTLESNRNYDVSQAPKPHKRFRDFLSIDYPSKMVSIEPILDFDLDNFSKWIRRINPKFVSIGADSKNNELEEPESEKLERLIEDLRNFTEVKLKHNLNRLLPSKSE